MSCGTCDGAIHCDEIEAIRWLWSENEALNNLVPVATDETNRLFESGRVSGDALPYVVLRSLGELETGQYGLLGVRIQIFARSKANAIEIREAMVPVLTDCFGGLCIVGAKVLWGRLQGQGNGFRGKDVYYQQLLLRLRLSKEGI